ATLLLLQLLLMPVRTPGPVNMATMDHTTTAARSIAPRYEEISRIVTLDCLRRHRFDVPVLPLADWRIMRMRLTRLTGHWRRDSNLLAHRCASLDARRAILIDPPPCVPPRLA